jgi:D-alanyl-D-alanine carboxypeptidase/D-alanyl-D-alanine-endopeptidase (penicillin-binding protein 4)
MRIKLLLFLLFLISLPSLSQEKAFDSLLADSVMKHAAISFYVIDADSGRIVFDYNSEKSLIPASVMKLVTTSAAFELLGPGYTFKTTIGYTGDLNKRSGTLKGDIVIKGGGDPALGSKEFEEYYADFTGKWIDEIKKAGIKKINGRIITDDSRYDYQPVPPVWLWEDMGNYYGAGAYGLSLFDNYYEIHFKTSFDSSNHIITGVFPEECRTELSDRLIVSGTDAEGYVFAAPYNKGGWIAGTIPSNEDDFVLKASIQDPPLLMAEIIDKKLRSAGIKISGDPATARLESSVPEEVISISEVTSPPLKEIIEVLNHESVNLYAEHLLKELGKVFKNDGSTLSGTLVINEFLGNAGVNTDGMFIEDGSGLSPLDAVNAKGLVDLLFYMKNKGRYFNEFFASLPDAGKEGTLKNYFKDPAFNSRMSAKSGSMTRVRSYSGYIKTYADNDLIFSIIINNFSGPSRYIVAHIEEILKEIILNE